MTSPKELIASTVTEREWMDAVLQTAQLFGWRTYHTYDARRSPAGFPDLVLVRPPDVLFIELKTETGRASREQLEWLESLSHCARISAGIFRPTDDEKLVTLLKDGISAS